MASMSNIRRYIKDALQSGRAAQQNFLKLVPQSVVTTEVLTSNADVVLSAIPGMSVDVAAGKTYIIRAHFPVSIATAAHGIAFDFAGGTCTASWVRGVAQFYDSAAATTRAIAVTALNTLIDGSTTTAWESCSVEMSVSVSVAGTIVVQACQSASGASDSTVSIGAYMTAQEV